MFADLLTRRCLLTAALALSVGVGLTGCSEKIGDACTYNVDCSSLGDRLCDLAAPGGYCTIENCTRESCPDESVCVAFYPLEYLTTPCDADTEDLSTDACTNDEACTRSGFCAPIASVSRYCMKKCDASSDCRDAYECRRTGLNGAEPVPPVGEAYSDEVARFCAPQL